VAPPVVQSLVDGAQLKFTQANITNLSNGGFDLALLGSLTNIGPLDAKISFPAPVVITWQGHNIATISLPPVVQQRTLVCQITHPKRLCKSQIRISTSLFPFYW